MRLSKDLSLILSNSNFSDIIEVAKILKKNNGNLYLVGGGVRDIFLNLIPHDYDFCVTGITSDLFEKLFPQAIKQGKNFPVYILNDHEFAMARKESKTGLKHTDFNFEVTPSITIYDDLIRRDLTINSIAIDVLTNEIIDPFNGIDDIKNKVLKVTSSAFAEDPLRVYRVARLASQLNFNVSASTINIMKDMQHDLTNISVERVFNEFRKALNSNNPSNFFKVLKSAECLKTHFIEIYNLINVEQPLKYHPEGDVFNHTTEVLERVAKVSKDELIRFGGLVHDFGKAATPKANWPHHYDHDKLGTDIIKNFCNTLKMPTSFKKVGCVACQEHMLAGIYYQLKSGTKVKLFERIYRSNSLSLKGLEIIANADKIRETPISFANIGDEIMKSVKLEHKDLIKLSDLNNIDKIEKIKSILFNKRVTKLQELENRILKNKQIY